MVVRCENDQAQAVLHVMHDLWDRRAQDGRGGLILGRSPRALDVMRNSVSVSGTFR